VRSAEEAAGEAERLRLYYVAMTRAIDRLIVAGSVDPARLDPKTPIGWVLERVGLRELEDGDVTRGEAVLRVAVDRYAPQPPAKVEEAPVDAQLSLFEAAASAPPPTVPALPPLVPVAAPPVDPVRRLSYSALALFERCPYRFYAERLAGMRPTDHGGPGSGGGMAASEIGDSVHRLLERVDLAAPAPPSLDQVLAWYPGATAAELERIGALVEAYCSSTLAARLAALDGVSSERPFAFEHDGVLFHGVLDVLHLDGARALVADFKSNLLGEHSPSEIVDAEYRLQRLVYAIACFRAGADEVEVVYQFLERPDELVQATFGRAELPGLEAELSAAIGRIAEGRFPPRPSELACAGCPALDVVCAGPALAQ
jgi:ATP-dependent exoDNAse (exonuclease V) beta subunit